MCEIPKYAERLKSVRNTGLSKVYKNDLCDSEGEQLSPRSAKRMQSQQRKKKRNIDVRILTAKLDFDSEELISRQLTYIIEKFPGSLIVVRGQHIKIYLDEPDIVPQCIIDQTQYYNGRCLTVLPDDVFLVSDGLDGPRLSRMSNRLDRALVVINQRTQVCKINLPKNLDRKPALVQIRRLRKVLPSRKEDSFTFLVYPLLGGCPIQATDDQFNEAYTDSRYQHAQSETSEAEVATGTRSTNGYSADLASHQMCTTEHEDTTPRQRLRRAAPRNPEYTMKEDRLNTYEQWPRQSPSPEELSNAGFYFTGNHY